jgi:hypothetical protein
VRGSGSYLLIPPPFTLPPPPPPTPPVPLTHTRTFVPLSTAVSPLCAPPLTAPPWQIVLQGTSANGLYIAGNEFSSYCHQNYTVVANGTFELVRDVTVVGNLIGAQVRVVW